jgi:adenosylmethionine-8-amino-7-oxononanoate aminotransferase
MNASESWRERDRRVLWHPFTQQLGWQDEDFPVIASAEGVHLVDVDGRRYLDGVSSLWCNVHGHRVPALDDAIRAQLDRLAHSTMLGLSHPPAIALAERLVRLAPPGLTRVFYSDSGSEAMEIALKIAYQFWQQVEPGGRGLQPPTPAGRDQPASARGFGGSAEAPSMLHEGEGGKAPPTPEAFFSALEIAIDPALAAAVAALDDATLARALAGCPAPLAARVFRQVPTPRSLDVRRRLGRHGGDAASVAAARRALLERLGAAAPAPAGSPRARRTREPKRKQTFLTFGEAYHGDTIGSVSLGGIDLFHAVYGPLLFRSVRAPSPAAPGALAAVEALFERHHDTLAAAVVEPLIQGAAGMLVQPDGFLRRLRALCDAHDVLLLCDEVATGFGRTGTMFACEQEGVTPDLMAVAKGLTGGYLPLAATLATGEIYDAFLGAPAEKKTFFHGHTYTGNPLACAAALANLDVFEREQVIAGLPPKIAAFAEGLARFAEHPHVREVRRRGLMAGIELVKDKAGGAPYDDAERKGHQVTLAARARGVLIRPLGNVVVLMPPLAMTTGDLRRLLDATFDALDAATG